MTYKREGFKYTTSEFGVALKYTSTSEMLPLVSTPISGALNLITGKILSVLSLLERERWYTPILYSTGKLVLPLPRVGYGLDDRGTRTRNDRGFVTLY